MERNEDICSFYKYAIQIKKPTLYWVVNYSISIMLQFQHTRYHFLSGSTHKDQWECAILLSDGQSHLKGLYNTIEIPAKSSFLYNGF